MSGFYPSIRVTTRALLAGVVLSLLTVTASAVEVAGVRIDDRARVAQYDLQLNGAGTRTKFMFKVYIAALYLPERKSSTVEILALPGAKRVSMRLARDLSAEQLVDALEEGIRDNTSPAELEALSSRLAELKAIMLEVKQGRDGDLMTLDFLPGTGTQVAMNGTVRGKIIAGDDFYRALLRIWLGDNPVSKDLKKALLGQS
jgi:hypothetical protein